MPNFTIIDEEDRMSHPTVKVDFFDPRVSNCSYPAYALLRDEAPVWKDPATGM